MILSQDISQTVPLWDGSAPSTQKLSPPTSPDTAPTVFRTSTNELDRYRVLFLIVGLLIGAMLLGKK
jgi:hypothetical protein